MNKAPFLSLIAFIYLLLSGCNLQGPDTNTNINYEPTTISTSQPGSKINQDHAAAAKTILLNKDEVKWVRAVESKDLLIVAVELEHWNTFQSKKLIKEMKKTLKKDLKIKNIEVTTDHKIFIELEKLEKKLSNNDISKKKLDKELKKISKLMKEQT